MKIHDPMYVAQVAASLLSGKHDAEPHHIKSAVTAARGVLDEAYLQAGEAEAAAIEASAEVPSEKTETDGKESQ